MLRPTTGRREASNLWHQPVMMWGSLGFVSSVVGGEAVGTHVRGAWEQDQTTGIAVEAISRRIGVGLVTEAEEPR